jgi:predicted metalloprotease with PDZ domain/endonuclease/exonuclease/phosphatase family metal-dependent hydrolase
MLSSLLLFLPTAFAQLPPTSGVEAEYTFTYTDVRRCEVDARLTLTGLQADAGPVSLSLPQGFAFAQLPEPRLSGEVELGQGSTATLLRKSPYRWTLQVADEQPVSLEWTVPLDHRTQPEVAGRDEYEYPYLQEDHGMLVMGTMALAPDHLDAIRVNFVGPEDWQVVAPWPKTSAGWYAPESLGALRDDLIAVGEWKFHRQIVRGMNLTMAFSPQQQFLFDKVVAETPAILEAELELFGCTPQSDYLFLFGDPQSGGAGGSPKTSSMTLFVDPNLPADFAASFVSHLIAHEFHHTWMRARCQPVDELRYVMEGFTDYYAYLVPWRLGSLSDEEFVKKLEGKFAEAEAALAQTSLEEAGGPAFFRGGEAHYAVYAGGLVLALWLDLALREFGDTTLDQLMRDFYENPKWRDGTRPTVDDFWQLVDSKADLSSIARPLTTSVGFDGWQQAFLKVGLVSRRSMEQAALEVRANFDGTTITAIDPSGTGAKIGLQNGDELLKVNGVAVADAQEIRNAFAQPVDGELTVRIKRGAAKRNINQPIPQQIRFQLPMSVAKRIQKSAASNSKSLQGSRLDLTAPPKSPSTLRVMQFNLWQEGTSVKDGFNQIADVIAASNADLIALSEVRNYNKTDLHQRLLEALRQRGCDYHAQYAGGDVGLLSRWPIQKAEAVADETAKDHGSVIAFHIKHPSGRKIVFCSAHLDYLNYAIYLPRGYDGNSFKIIDPDGDGVPNPVTDLAALHAMDLASKRDESIESFLSYAKKSAPKNAIQFLVGDFNESTHLDWTAATKDLYDHNGVVIEWQNSQRLSNAGFIDSWRALHPNPVTHPGATWPSPASSRGSTSWTPKADERDRIDFIYSNQRNIQPVAAWIVGPQSYWLKDHIEPCTTSDSFTLTDHPWPSDHKGLIVDFKVNPID